MSAETTEMRLAIEDAIYREIGARNFYRSLADSIENRDGKEKFSRLSEDEDGHRTKLEGWFKTLFGIEFVHDRERIRESEIPGVAIDGQAGALAALDIAIQAETHAIEFYGSQAGKARDGGLIDLFRRLADEERGHLSLLEAERNSIIGGFYWFDMDSASFLED